MAVTALPPRPVSLELAVTGIVTVYAIELTTDVTSYSVLIIVDVTFPPRFAEPEKMT